MAGPKLVSVMPMIPAGGDLAVALAYYAKLGFSVDHKDPGMAIIRRDTARLMLLRNTDKHLADNTALRIETQDVAALYKEFQQNAPSAIHPNGALEKKPWGCTEFAIIDPAGVCITFFEFGK